MAIVACSGVAGYSVVRPVGDHKVYSPQKIELSDNEYAMASWNMQGKAKSKRKALKRLIARHSLDGMALQEVYGTDIAPLRRTFKAWTLIDSPADSTRHRSRGGYHNVLMVRGEVNEVKSASISRVEHFEQRSAVVAETPMVFGSSAYDVVLGTTHVGRGARSSHEQFPEMVDFFERSTKSDASVVVCGDFNRGINTTQRYFGESWSISDTDDTTPSGHKVDFCLSQNDGPVTITSAFVDKTEETDHYPVIVEFAPSRIDIAEVIDDYLYRSKVNLVNALEKVRQDVEK